jgi:hypothetical protein
MSLSESDSKLVKAATALVFGRNAQRRKLAEETRQYATRSGKIAKAYRQKILNKAFATAGIDQEEIRKRQLENDEADRKFLASIEPILTENARLTNARNKLLIEGLQSKYKKFLFPKPHPMPPPPPPQLPLWDVLTTADSFTIEPGAFGAPLPNFSTSIAAFENIVHFSLPPENNSYNIVASFLWTPPADGYLNLLSVVAFNGSNWWGAKHGCIETLVDQEGTVGLWLTNPQSATPQDSCDEQSFLYNSRDWTPGCSSDVGTNVIDQPIYLTAPTVAQVTAGQTLVISVVLAVQNFSDEAIGEIDFFNNGKSINITGVILNLTSTPNG